MTALALAGPNCVHSGFKREEGLVWIYKGRGSHQTFKKGLLLMKIQMSPWKITFPVYLLIHPTLLYPP